MSRKPLLQLTIGLSIASLIAGCPTVPNGDPNDNGTTAKPRHEQIFTEIIPEGYEGPASCQVCHCDEAQDLLAAGHWKWEGTTVNINGLETETHGKRDLLNNFCVAVPANEGRCSQCHPSYGWKDNTFDFTDASTVDCLVCHDTTGTYAKHPSANGGGGPAALRVEGELVLATAADLQSVAYNVGAPTRANCGFCHFYAGGGDNVKHGDLSSDLVSPTAEMDVHMGGRDFTCQTCHTAQNHGIAGMALHSVDEGGRRPDCTRCHGETNVHATNDLISPVLNFHLSRVACETCHIPTFARSMPTKVEWYWEDAGQDVDPIPVDEFGKPTYDKKKGTFVWDKNVQPSYHWFDGKWNRMVIGLSDTYANAGTVADPVVIAEPTATAADEDAKVYPFKRMIGSQPADAVEKRLLVPHLFGSAAGENAFWAKYDWGAAIAEGAAYAGQPYSGEFEFANTVMYLRVSHEVAPASQALHCDDCHGVTSFWQQLGIEDPFPG